MMLNDMETYPHQSNWAMQVRNILHNTGSNDVSMLQGVWDTTGSLNVFKQRVSDKVRKQPVFNLNIYENSSRKLRKGLQLKSICIFCYNCFHIYMYQHFQIVNTAQEYAHKMVNMVCKTLVFVT